MKTQAYKLTWWMDCGCFDEVFDTIDEALSKRHRVEDMGAYKTTIEGVME